MNKRQQIALIFLRWSVGIVVIWESCRFALSVAAAQHFYRLGLPYWTRPVLAICEVVAAILFLSQKWERLGGYSLLLVFAIAVVLHMLHGQFEISPLLVYAAAVLVCIWVKRPARARTAA